MSFFARPNLDNVQFKQLVGTTLTLSGQTQIATTSGLTLTDGIGGYIPLIATGATEYSVMTYHDGIISLRAASGATGGQIYSGASPTTCTVGGLVSGTTIAGCTISNILENVLAPTLYPELISPSSLFDTTPMPTQFVEVGCVICPSSIVEFDAGCIVPNYCGGPSYRSGDPTCYEYMAFGMPCCTISNNYYDSTYLGPHTITYGSNPVSSRVWHDAGGQPLDSKGNPYSTPYPAYSTPWNTVSYNGIYPFYYGVVTSCTLAGTCRPLPTQALITGGTKVIACSYNTICINFNSTANDYIWFAIPNLGGMIKTFWCVCGGGNSGCIGGPVSPACSLFPYPSTVVGVSSNCWSNQAYRVYISNYQTKINTIMYIKNSCA